MHFNPFSILNTLPVKFEFQALKISLHKNNIYFDYFIQNLYSGVHRQRSIV